MIRGNNLRLISICLMMIFIFQLSFPTVSLALTGGPSQPETDAFTPVGSSNLVNLQTGDFNYSIPLLTIPGPNGGESLTLGYNAGVTMEQEASWVGFGWNLNVGAINRNLRGLPDDFKGDIITQNHKQRPRRINTTTLGGNAKYEVFGQKLAGSSFDLGLSFDLTVDNYYNNYLGFSVNAGLNLSNTFSSSKINNVDGINFINTFTDNGFRIIGLNSGLQFSRDGLSIPVGFYGGYKMLKASLGLNFGGVQSLKQLNFSVGFRDHTKKTSSIIGGNYMHTTDNHYYVGASYGSVLTFAKTVPTPSVDIPSKTFSFNLNFKKGFEKSALENDLRGFNISDIYTETKYETKYDPKSYGYLYSEEANELSLTDFHLDKATPFSDMSSQLPLPVYDYDVYSVSGNGVGGTFRAYRNDIGILAEPVKTSTSFQVGIGYQKSSAQLGIDTKLGSGSVTYSGPWSTWGDKDVSNNINEINIGHKGERSDVALYKPFYFQFTGSNEIADKKYIEGTGNDKRVNLGVSISGKSIAKKYGIRTSSFFGQLANSAKNKIGYEQYPEKRQVQAAHIGYKTNKELKQELIDNPNKYKHIYQSGNPIVSSASDIEYASHSKEHHINEMTVENGGVKYVYGLPAYNTNTREVMFSIPSTSVNDHLRTVPNNYNNNTNGFDHLYTEKIIPEYVYSYLLTAKYSNNYVDINNDGPTDDDLGGWVKYNYSKVGDFNWRGPYSGASYLKGAFSWSEDDKATFTEGKKDMYYVNSIESKTHIAIFELGERNDNTSSANDSGSFDMDNPFMTNVNRSKFLKKIVLYSKKDTNYGNISLMTPIKTVHFVYDYSLCKNVPNYKSGGDSSQHILEDNGSNRGGKLTLKKVYFTYEKNTKGELIPYEFTYGKNENYTYMSRTDRWGNYLAGGDNSKDFPYVSQLDIHAIDNDDNASMWNLTEITTPSGGEIEIEYESDDYGYVQDKQAMQMCEIVGVGRNYTSMDTDNNLPFDKDKDGDMLPDFNCFLFFKGNSDFTSKSEVEKYLKNMPTDWLYFSVNVELKAGNYEVITGYAKWDGDLNNVGTLGTNGYFRVKAAKYQIGKPKKEKEGFIHPFRKSALQHFHGRPDFKPKVAPIKQQIKTYLKGPLHNYLKKGYAKNLVSFSSLPKNHIKLMNPDFKKDGGGHRVKSIRISSSDGETYGQKYFYTAYQEDGAEISSGVADYEPIIGGEENALRIPVNYNDILDYNTETEGDFFLKKPYMEAFYPAPVVIYGRVTVRNLTLSEINGSSLKVANKGGITINEFYTSKDFPINEDTHDKQEQRHHRRRIPVPFVPMTISEDNAIFSGASVIELNNMSGKSKSKSTFNEALLTSSAPDDFSVLDEKDVTTKVEFIYQTREGDSKRLDNTVTVLTQDGVKEEARLGQKHELYAHHHENFQLSRDVSTELNIIGDIFWPVWPSFNNSKTVSQRRSISTVKVINKSGILKEVKTIDDGRKTVAKNVAFDAQTGEVLLSFVQNDWDKPIYSYNYAGHWKYPILGGKYQNYRAKFKVTRRSSKLYEIEGYNLTDNILQIGDVLRSESGKMAYVTEIDLINNRFKASSKKNLEVINDGDIVTVYESGYKNLQGISVGSIVSLTNPLNFVKPSSYLEKFVHYLSLSNGTNTTTAIDNICGQNIDFNDFKTGVVFSKPSTYGIHIQWPETIGTKGCNIHFEGDDEQVFLQVNDIDDFFSKLTIFPSTLRSNSDGTRYLIDVKEKTSSAIATAEVWTDCEVDCNIEGVLHASAIEFSDQWDFNYVDAGDIRVVRGFDDYPMQAELDNGNYNVIAAKNKGSWYPSTTWVYQTLRKQVGGVHKLNGVNINKDGEYKKFKLFKWGRHNKVNQKNDWEWPSKMTKYSPFGNALEEKNRLGIYSAELYGYKNSLVTAVAVNAEYNEIAYESFEEVSDFGVLKLGGHFTGVAQSTMNSGHTGKSAMLIDNGDSALSLVQTNFKPKAKEKYHISTWIKTYNGYGGSLEVSQSGTKLTTISTEYTTSNKEDHGREIDKWTQASGSFTTIDNSDITLVFKRDGNSSVAFDDLRIFPMNASMQTYVYNPLNFKLIATLDDNNFATFYGRDSEGKLVIVKKETDKGVVTVNSSRDNIVKK